jgi:phage gpG-like protein
MSIEGLPELRARIGGIIERSQNLGPGLLRAGVAALDIFKERIEEGGPGWRPNVSGTPLLRRTGHLFNSLTAGASDDVLSVSGDTVTAGTNVFYGKWLQGGTGIYGDKGQRIRPKDARALSFMLGGRRIFAESIAGSPKREFVYIDDKVAETVRAVFAEYIMEGSNGPAN